MRLFYVVVMICSGATAHADSEVSFPTSRPSFGVIQRTNGPDPTLTVPLRNVSDQPVNIGSVMVGCGCVEGAITPGELAPGALTEARFRLKLASLRPGRITYPVTVVSTAGVPLGSSEIGYAYFPTAIPSVQSVFLGRIALGAAPEPPFTFRLAPGEGKILQRIEVLSEDPVLRCSAVTGTGPGGGYIVTVGTNPERQTTGPHTGEVRVYVNGDPQPEVTLPVSYTIVPPVHGFPERVLFGRIRPGTSVVRTIQLRSEHPYTVSSVRSTCPSVALVVDPKDSATYHLRCAPATDADGTVEGFAVFEFDSPLKFHIDVPLAAEIRR